MIIAKSPCLQPSGRNSSLMEYQIRSATPGDTDIIMSAFGGTLAEITREQLDRRMSVFQDGVKIIVEQASRKCVGLLFSEIWDFKRTREFSEFSAASDISNTHDYNGTELHIAAVSIVEDLKDTGLADYLMTSAINSLRVSYPRLRSVVTVTNQGCRKSREFFSKRRFIAVDQISGFNGRPGSLARTGIVMRKFFGLADSPTSQIGQYMNLVHSDFALV